MMSSAKNVVFERPIEVYENERLWIGRGFSAKGLIPTERGPYSTEDGSLSWKTVREAGLALLRGEVVASGKGGGNNGKALSRGVRRGWSFHEEDDRQSNFNSSDKGNLREEDEYECSTKSGDNTKKNYCGFIPCMGPEVGPTDGDGWQYFPDFSPQSLVSPSRKRGMLDFVRRRKLCRMAVFRPDHFLPRGVHSKCDFCDSQVVDMLSSAMLDAVSLATLFAHGAKNNITDAQALPLKSKLVDSLSIGRNCKNDRQSKDYDPWADIYKVRDRLHTFAEESVGKPGALAHLINPDVNQDMTSAMPGRRRAMSKYLSDEERLRLARLLVRDVDRHSYRMHCGNDSCSWVGGISPSGGFHRGEGEDDPPSCEFRIMTCPNRGCAAVFSFKHRTQHDGECAYKLVPCPNGCGARVPRSEVHVHVRDRCNLRQAACPLSIVGCTAIVQAQDVTRHLNDHAHEHFILVANRMMEYQNVMKDLNARVRMLEERNGKLERELRHATAQLQSKDEAKAVTNDVRKLTKRLGTLEGTCRAEFKQLEYDRRNR